MTDKQRDPLSQPTRAPEIFQVTPHLYKFNRPGEGSNFSIIVADSGRAIIADCGLMSPDFLDRALAGMRKHQGLKQIDAMVISHMHGDHFLLGGRLREKYGAQIWTLDRIADKCEHPEHYDHAAMIQSYNAGVDRLIIDRRLRDGEVINWEGYRLQVDWMPGQTEFGCCLWLELDGKRIAFTGDNIFGDPADPDQDGHEAVVARNSAIFEEGYLFAAGYLKKLRPDLLMGGHSFVMPEPAAFIDRYHRWAQAIIRAYQGLMPGTEYRYGFDPYWIKAEPYRVSIEPGRSTELHVVVRNFRGRDQRHRIEIDVPPGLTATPRVLEGVVGGTAAKASFPVRLQAQRDAEPGLHIAAFDMTIDGQRYGQWFDAVVHVTTLSAGAPTPPARPRRFLIRNNLFEGIERTAFMITSGADDVEIDHNTFLPTNYSAFIMTGLRGHDASGMVLGKPCNRFKLTNNIMGFGLYGPGVDGGRNTLAEAFPAMTWDKNLFVGYGEGRARSAMKNRAYPAGCLFEPERTGSGAYGDADWPAVGFADYGGGDYRLVQTSTYRGRATDGKDVGVDIDALSPTPVTR